MYPGVESADLKAYIVNKFVSEGDFDFLKTDELNAVVDALIALDEEYMQKSGANDGELYDEDDAYDYIFAGLTNKFAQYKMYCMRLAEDYLDFVEEYLVSVGAIEWE